MSKFAVDLVNGSDTVVSQSNNATFNISGASRASVCRVTITGHTFLDGDYIYIAGVVGMTQLNTSYFFAKYIDANNIDLYTDSALTSGVNSTAYGTYTSGGVVYPSATRANPVVITRQGHGMDNGQIITVTTSSGMSQLANNTYKVANVTTNTFSLKDLNDVDINGTAYGGTTTNAITYTQARLKPITGATQANPVVITSKGHGFSNGNLVYIDENVGGMTQIRNKFYTVANATTDTFELSGINGTGYSAFTSGGYVHRPFLTMQVCANHFYFLASDTMMVSKTTAYSTITGANLTWTDNSATVSTSASLTASISAGDYIARPIGAGNGAVETYYKVTSITATTITLNNRYYGTTGTDTNAVRKVVPVSAGLSGSAILSTSKNSIIVAGGYTFAHDTTPTQNGETWLKHAFSKATSGNLGISLSGTGQTVDRMNVVDCYVCITLVGTTPVVINCYTASGGIYPFRVAATTLSTISDTVAMSGSASYAGFNIEGNVTFTNGYGWSFGNGYAFNMGAVTVTGGSALCSYNGFGVNGVGSTLTGFDTYKCSNAGVVISSTGGGSFINDFEIVGVGGAYGFYIGTASYSLVIRDGLFTGAGAGTAVFITQSRGIAVEDCVFSGYAYDVWISDTYSSDIFAINNSHTTPTTFAYGRGSIGGGTVYITKCTIDAPSLAKAYQIVDGTSYVQPQYVIQDSFGGIYGSFYARHSVQRDTSILSTDGYYTTKFTYNTTVSNNRVYYPVASFEGVASQAQTISYDIRANGVWSGTIVPVIKLNGVIIKTGTTISSVSNGSWDTKSISVTSGEVTDDGELTLEFLMNSNAVAINVGDVAIS